FMLEPLPYEQDYARVEDQETIDRLYYLLPLSYKQLGYDVISVPAMSISERVEFILERTIPQHQP
ncbi:hypothetical protein JXC34_01515, partial [Candidatus Woesearchaeota archaeon]|nr:hypothetical protein [Candidatus Woesearchaeota archaeon]